MKQQRRFTKEFEDEAVRLVRTSGRTQREIAEDYGVGLSTLVRWLGRSRGSRIGSAWRIDSTGRGGGAEAAAAAERDPSPGAGHPEARHRFFRPGGKSVSFRLVDEAKKEFPVHRLCRVLGVSQIGYFAWKGRPACRRQHEDMVLLAHVRSAFALSNGTYGSPRMTRELRDGGLTVGRHRTARLIRENGLRARQKRRFKRTTDSHHTWPVAPNLLDQDFTAAGPDEKWGADISTIWTKEGWLYLAVVIDLFGRRAVGWSTSDRLHRDLALAALRKAVVMRRLERFPA